MKDIEVEAFAGEVNKFVSERLEPVSEKVSELTERLDDIAKQPAPVNGKDGKDGADGAQGDTGEKGADGLGLDIPAYAGGVYREGSIVQANFGQAFRALVDTAEGVDSEDWERIGTHGFRLTGPYSADKTYQPGDLFIKDFGLFLHDGNEAKLIAGRGPEGKKGRQGPAGKDGVDGQDGADGKDGSQIEAMEIKGTSLVLVVKDADGEVKSFDTDLAPFLDAAVEVTKSLTEDTTKAQAAEVEAQVKNLWNHFQEHLTDQQAIPVRFFRGMWTTALSYQTGDMVKYASSLYVAKRGSTGIMPHGQLSSDINSGDYWAQLTSGGGGGAGGDVDLTGYVKRPVSALRDGRWLAYREINGGTTKEWSPITTDMIETNGMLMFRDSLGRFQPTPEELDELNNQLKVNRFIWDKIQQLDLKAGGVAISEDPPDDPDNGMFWFDNSADVMQLYIWHTDSDAWIPVAPPTTLEGRVAAGETTQAAIIAQIQQSLVDQAALADRITAGEAEQSTLKNKVNALEGVIGEYSLVFTMDNSNPRAGEFNLKDGAMQVVNTLASADYITLSDTDSAGNPINLDRITEGDVLRFSSVDGQAAEIKITDGSNGVYAFNKVSGELDRLSDMPYQFILLSSFDPTGLATIEYVDAQDATKMSKGGEQMLASGFWRVKQPKSGGGNSTYININDEKLHLYHVADPKEPEHAANQKYVDDQIAAIPQPSGGGGSTFRVVEVNNTIQMQDGDIWMWNDKAYVSWKTLEGRIWCPNPTLEEWKNWPEGTEHGGQTHGRWIPETYMVWESVEDGHPYGMTTVNKVDWKTYLDENGNVIGREGYDTMAIKLTWANPANYTTYPTFPPVGKIIRVRFAPWL